MIPNFFILTSSYHFLINSILTLRAVFMIFRNRETIYHCQKIFKLLLESIWGFILNTIYQYIYWKHVLTGRLLDFRLLWFVVENEPDFA